LGAATAGEAALSRRVETMIERAVRRMRFSMGV
jgi:hypothetical protein